MVGFQINDWDDAYDNRGNIVGAVEFMSGIAQRAQNYRSEADCELDIQCGTDSKARYDLFLPECKAKGLFIFVHGGYWQVTDKSMWSFLAKGAVDAEWAVAIPYYDLCPTIAIKEIINMVAESLDHAAHSIDGPIILSGHSAGGHIVASLMTEQTPLTNEVIKRVKHVTSISGLCDLRPFLNTKLNDALQLDWDSATTLSPVLMAPLQKTRLTAWVGGNERSEFIRQNRLLADMWHGLGANTQIVEEPDKHHFSVVAGLEDKNSPLLKTILGDL